MARTLAVFILLAPVFVSSYRPVHVPKNLFVQIPGREDVTRVIRQSAPLWQASPSEDDQPSVFNVRTRRATSGQPEVNEPFVAGSFHSLLSYWPSDREKEGKILLLGRASGGVGSSTVYLTQDYGRTWSNINTQLKLKNGANANINSIYTSKTSETLSILTDVTSKMLFISKNMTTFQGQSIDWTPSFISIHPTDTKYVMGFDQNTSKLYWSIDSGRSFQMVAERVKSFYWGVPGIDSDNTIFVEKYRSSDSQLTTVQRIVNHGSPEDLLDYVDEFVVEKNFMFATVTKSDKSIMFMVSFNRGAFVEAKFPLREKNRDFFVFDVADDQVFVVINHLQNMSNMYVSDYGGVKYTLSLPRVLYHHPDTDVSSHWLRATVRYAFVDVHKVQTMKGVYVATQLTPGPVGRRHLLSLITYDKGAIWQRIRAPERDIRGARTLCYLPTCSLHFNLVYGSVYRVSPSESLLSKPSAPGLVLALGVASTNLKIHPDLYVSVDGGVNWKKTLRGKYQYAFGDHGSVIVALPFRRNTRTLRYSVDGGDTWPSYVFSKKAVQVQDVVTQMDEKLPVFLIYATTGPQAARSWRVFFVNMTNVLDRRCTPDDYMTWIPSDTGVGERCLLGQKTEFQTRNWTVKCLVGKDYVRKVNTSSCLCRRTDFQCDFGFERKEIDQDCSGSAGENLDANLIPEVCEEGQYYNRSIGFRKIPGNLCQGGEEKDFAPKLTPCPAQELGSANLTSSMTKDGVVPVPTNTEVPFNAAIEKGYWPNIRLRWDFGDKTAPVTKQGKNGSVISHKYNRPGHYIALVTLTNTKTIKSRKLHIFVQDLLDQSKLSVSFSPAQPRYDENVTFLANLEGYNYESYGHVTFQWYALGQKSGGDQSVFTFRFTNAGAFTVMVAVSNRVSNLQKNVTVKVHPDLTPKNVRARVLGATTVRIFWDKPREGDEYITGYKIFQKSNSGSFHSVVETLPAETSGVVEGLAPATPYYFKVVTRTKSVGEFESTEVVAAVTNMSIPGMPQDVKAESLSDTSIKLTWKPPAETGDGVMAYKIRQWSETNPAVVEYLVGAEVRGKEFAGLEQDTVYYFEVIAVSTLADGAPTAPVSARTKVSTPSQPPRNLKHVTDNGTCAYLSWEPPYVSAVNKKLFPAEGYKVYFGDDLKRTLPGKYVQLCGLQPATAYTVSVAAYTAAGVGPDASVSFTTQSAGVDTPRNLKAEALSSSQIKITWDIRPDAKNVKFLVRQISPAGSDQPVVVAASLGAFVMNDLKAFTSYTFSVGVHVGVSSVVSARTREDYPGVVEYVNAVLVRPKSSTIRLTWSAPSEPKGVIKEYKIRWSDSRSEENKEVSVKATPGSSQSSYTFGNLRKSTKYTFSVVAVNSFVGQTYSKAVTQTTDKAIQGTERLQMKWSGADLSKSARDTTPSDPKQEFVQGASKFAKVDSSRFADVDVRPDNTVEFDLLPPGDQELSNEDVKSTLDNGFTFGARTVQPSSLKVLETYGESNTAPTASLGAQTGNKKSSFSSMWLIGIIIPIVIGLALLAGMVFYYRKYKALEHLYTKAVYQPQDDDQMGVVYDGLASTESPGVMFSDLSPNKKRYRDAEKIPLGEHDELSMV